MHEQDRRCKFGEGDDGDPVCDGGSLQPKSGPHAAPMQQLKLE
jgi:hypothetical protein